MLDIKISKYQNSNNKIKEFSCENLLLNSFGYKDVFKNELATDEVVYGS